MRIAVLASPSSWYLSDLRRAAADRHDLFPCAFGQLWASVCPGGQSPSLPEIASGDIDLTACDAVLVRTMPPGSLEQVVFRMDALARLEQLGIPAVNPPRAIESAVDKYLCTARLHEAGLLVPRTVACQTTEAAMTAFAELASDVVVKPIFGGEGRGIARLNDAALAERAFKMLAELGAVLYLQEFIPHAGHDLRVLKVGRRFYGMRRANPDDWRTNVSRGAETTPLELTPEQIEFADRAATAIGAPIAGVDLLPGCDGRLYAIEVNAVPGWRALSRTLHVDIAREVLEYIEGLTGQPRFR